MNKSFKLKTSMLAIATLVMVLVSCSDGDEEKNPTVEIPPLKVTPAKLTLSLGDKGTVGANVAPVTWSSNATSIVTVDASTGEVEGLALGEATVTATMSGGETASATVTVVPVRLEDFSLTPGSATIGIDSTVQIVATPVPANTTYFNPVWSSSDESVATVTQTGLVTGISIGTATISIAEADTVKYVTVRVTGEGIFGAELFRLATGYWLAENLGAATTGTDLEVGGGPVYPTETGAIRAPKGSYFIARHGIATEGGRNVEEYTLLIDFSIPYSGWHSLFQTNMNNSDDADCFIHSNGTIGVSATGYHGSVQTSTWYRVVITRKAAGGVSYDIYLDGTKIGHSDTSDGRLTWSPEGVILFGDDSGEDEDIDVKSIAIWGIVLTPEQIASLGGAQ